MKARFAQVCAAITVAVFALVTVFFILRLSEAYESSVLNRTTQFQALSQLVQRAYEADDNSFENLAWERLAQEFDLSRTAEAVVIASGEGQIEYLTARDQSYLHSATRSQIGGSGTQKGATALEYLVTRSQREMRLSETIATEGGSSIHIEAIYPTLANADIYPLLRDTFFILLGFAGLTLVSALGLYLHRISPEEEPNTAHLPDKSDETDEPEDNDTIEVFDTDLGIELDEDLDAELDLDLDRALDLDLDLDSDRESSFDSDPDGGQDSISDRDPQKAKLLRRLSSELERSTYNEEDLVLALLRPSSTDAKQDPDTPTVQLNNDSRMIDRLYSFIAVEHAFKELTFILGDDIIAVIEPNNDLDGGMRRMENLLRKADERAMIEGGSLHAGLSARTGRLTESPRLFKEAYTALRRAEHRNAPLIAFRPDPDLYRRFLAGEGVAVESS